MPNPSEPQTSAASSALYDPAELTPENWERAAARLLAKMIGEFAYEEIIEPKREPEPEPEPERERGPEAEGGPGPAPGRTDLYTLPVEGAHMPPGSAFRFRARRGAYGSWLVDPGSIQWIAGSPDETAGRAARTDRGADAAEPKPSPPATNPPERFTDPLVFLLRAKHVLGLDGATLGHLIRELTVTLAADARLDHTALTAAQLAELGYAELEGHQTGHPWLVLNKGRLGFSASDTARWAPEARIPGTLPWIAVHTRIAAYRGVADLATADRLYDRELSPAARDSFAEALRERGLDPRAYLYLPVHPWQWSNIVLPLFAGPVATDAIVPLPTDGDVRLPQQSIRTFLNISRPDRHTVKLPLSVLNTLVWRGLPTERTLAAPSVTAWMHS
ncbi:IucA/IucC family protein, partial [Streptomyces sp. NPDC056121]